MIESEHPIKVVHDFRRDARAAASETVYKGFDVLRCLRSVYGVCLCALEVLQVELIKGFVQGVQFGVHALLLRVVGVWGFRIKGFECLEYNAQCR